MIADPTYDETTDLTFVTIEEAQSLAAPQAPHAEPEGNGGVASMAASAAALAQPAIPGLTLTRRAVSGRYRRASAGLTIELRVDVDGHRPTRRISGDLFQQSGATTTYFGSFVVKAPSIVANATTVRIEGTGEFTWSASAPRVRVTIPRTTTLTPSPAATLQFLTAWGAPGASYTCPFFSPYFRAVSWEQDCVTGATAFVSYSTGSLPQPPASAARVLTVSRAYQEAGIDLQTAGVANVVPVAAAGGDAKWTDAELHAAMVQNFSLWTNLPQWKVYLLVATSHVGGYRGIMFDYTDAYQRQGCAVFHDAVQGADPASQRAQLRTYVHELGHCFNLLHSWQKNLATPPAPLGPNGGLGDLSWMNYTWQFQPPPPAPGGEAAYWASFPFQFTDAELVHLRHAFYKNIALGANPFGTGAAEVDPDVFAERLEDNSGLRLELRAKPVFGYGEPVVVEIKLATTDLRGRRAHAYLHPNASLVQIAIHQPSGRTVLYRPMIEHCADETRTIALTAEEPAAYTSAYIGYGKEGFYFDQPGAYQLRGVYVAPDGSRVLSPAVTLRVRSPHAAVDEEVGELLMGDEQGRLFYLLGSDAESLRRGNEALDLVLAKYAEHPLAVYPRLVKGINAERDFKRLGTDKVVTVRKANAPESIQHLTAVVGASTADRGVDNITLNMAMRRLAHAHRKAGDVTRASGTMDEMVQVFSQKRVRAGVLRRIAAMAEAEKAALAQV